MVALAPFLDRGEKIVAARVSDSEPAKFHYPDDGRYFARDDETPRNICKNFGVNLDRFLKINKETFPEMLSSSKLKGGTCVHLPKRDLRWLLTEQIGKGVKIDKKKRYTVRDIEPENLPKPPGSDPSLPNPMQPGKTFEGIESKRVQEYPQLNNTYAQGEIVCALWACADKSIEPDPLNNQHWFTEFSYAVFCGLDKKDPTRAKLKYENDKYTLDHNEEDLIKVVPLGVIIKREKEKRDRDEGGGDGEGGAVTGTSEIHILDPYYEQEGMGGLGMRKFIYDSMTKHWHDSMDKNRSVRFRIFMSSAGKDDHHTPSAHGRQEIDVQYVDKARTQTPPPSPPRWTEDLLTKRCLDGDEAAGTQGLWVPKLRAESEGMAWESSALAGTEEERDRAAGKPCMAWWYTDLGGKERSWTARKPIDTLKEPAPYVVLW